MVGALALGLATMSYSAHAQDKGLVGVLMPTKTSQRWINDGDAVKSQLEALGYTVDLQYAQDDIANQLSQLENEITKGPEGADHRLDRRHHAVRCAAEGRRCGRRRRRL